MKRELCMKLGRSYALAWAFAFLQIQLPATCAQETLTFRVGASIGLNGPCAPLYNNTVLGYQYFFDWLIRRPPILVTDASGKAYQLRLQLRLISHNCTEAGRAAAMTSLINGTLADPATGAPAQPPVHLLLGGNGDNALEDALQADAASRLLLHCCTARDSVFHRGLPHVYGLFTPASLYTGTVLRTMALRGVRRVAVVYNRESPLHVQLCEGALAQLVPLGELRPGFGAVLTLNYSAAEAESPGFWAAAGARVAAAGADALVACDAMNRTSLLVHQLRKRGHRLSAMWLASSGKVGDFLDYLDGRGEYALTTVQWMPNLPYADPDFGTAAEYAAAFAAATGRSPSYFSAAATASGYVLLTALQQSISICNLDNITADQDAADAFMWVDGAVTCVDTSRSALDVTGSSGNAVLRYVFSILNLNTFFGPVGFNGYHQNIFHPVIVAQVLSGDMVAVLPLDVADKALVMPIPGDPTERKAWAATPAGISIITLLFCLGAVCLSLAFSMCKRRVAPYLHTVSVELRMEDIQVDIRPQLNPDGSFEPGEGVYRGARVKLVVASELLPAPGLTAHRSARERGTPVFMSNPSGNLEDREVAPAPQAAAPGGAPASGQLTQRLPWHATAFSATTADERRGVSRPQLYVETSEVPGYGAAGGGYGKQSTAADSGLQTTSVSSVAGPPVPQLSSGASGPGRFLPSAMSGALGKRSRRQILALVWRAVRLQHPRMCPVLGIVWEWSGLLEGGGKVPVLVRQWHEFDSLEHLLENETVPLPLLTKGHIAQGVAEGLAYLHAQEPPILAGPLEATRIIIDKHFNPHLFLRLRNLDPEYGTSPADGSRVSKLRAMSVFGGRPGGGGGGGGGLHQHLGQKSLSPAAPRPSISLPTKSSLPPLPPSALPQSLKMVMMSVAPPEPATASTAVLPFTVTGPADEDLPATGAAAVPAPRLKSVSVGFPQAPRPPPPPRQATATSLLSSEAEPTVAAMAGSGRSTILGVSGGGGGVSLFAPPPQYQPSKQQDLYEFGLLLCRIFIVASPEDSGRLRFANIASAAVAAVAGGDAAAAAGGGGASAAPAPPLLLLQTADPDQLESALGELSDICPDLGDLARACVQPQQHAGLTFPAIAKALEQVVIPALTGSDGLPRGLRRNPLSVKAYGVGGGSGRVGGGSAALGSVRRGSGLVLRGSGGEPDLELRSVSSVCVRWEPSTLGMCPRLGSVTRPDHLRGVRANHHTAAASDDLIFEIFPPKVARALQAGETVQPERYECVSIFFSDVVGYTDLCAELQPGEVMDLVHRLYSRFDDLIREMKLFKVETVGDAYLAVGNLRWPQPDDHARLMAQFALSAVRAANSLPVHPDRPELGHVHIRVGLHCGPVVGSVVGTLNRRYCLFGDAVNTAARMEHNSKADRINCSGAFAALLREQWPGGAQAVSRGVQPIKGKGPMETFWVEEKEPPAGAAPPEAEGKAASAATLDGPGDEAV